MGYPSYTCTQSFFLGGGGESCVTLNTGNDEALTWPWNKNNNTGNKKVSGAKKYCNSPNHTILRQGNDEKGEEMVCLTGKLLHTA